MKRSWIVVVGAALLLSASAQAGPAAGPSSDLLAQVTSGDGLDFVPLTAGELEDIRGEGTIEKFISLPNLHRSFTRSVSLDNGLSVSIVAEAGVGITISITNPHIP